MTSNQSLALRSMIGISMGAASIVSWKLAPKLKMASQSFSKIFISAFALSRLGLFTLAMVVLHMEPRGDIHLYMEEAAPALAGKLVYRDFITPHAPLDPYLLSSMLRLHHSPLTIMLFANLFDILAMLVWMKTAKYFLDSLTLRRAALLVLFNPTSLLTVAIDGQMNAFIALLLALAVHLMVKRRDFLSGAAAAVPVAVIKFITLIYAPGFLFASRRKLVATLGFTLVLLSVYVPFALAGADIRVPFSAEGGHQTSSNLVFLFEMVTGHSLGLRLPDCVLGLSWLTIVLITFVSMRSASLDTAEGQRRIFYMLTVSMIAELLCLQIFSKNTWDRYLVMAMFPMCTVAATLSFSEIAAFGIWAAQLVVEPSYWAANATMSPSLVMHQRLLDGDPVARNLLLFEIATVAGSFFLWMTAVRLLLRLRSAQTLANDIPVADDLCLLPHSAVCGTSLGVE